MNINSYVKFTNSDIFREVDRITKAVEKDYSPEAVMGVYYGGASPAMMMRMMLGSDMIMLQISKYDVSGNILNPKPEVGHWYRMEGSNVYDPRNKHYECIVVVDDVLETGDTIKLAIDHAKQISEKVLVAVVFAKPRFHGHKTINECPLYIGREIGEEWVFMPWEKS